MNIDAQKLLEARAALNRQPMPKNAKVWMPMPDTSPLMLCPDIQKMPSTVGWWYRILTPSTQKRNSPNPKK